LNNVSRPGTKVVTSNLIPLCLIFQLENKTKKCPHEARIIPYQTFHYLSKVLEDEGIIRKETARYAV
jgi:hypothetical protein